MVAVLDTVGLGHARLQLVHRRAGVGLEGELDPGQRDVGRVVERERLQLLLQREVGVVDVAVPAPEEGVADRRRGVADVARVAAALGRHHEGGDDVAEAVVPDVAPQRPGGRLLERAQQLRGQRARAGAVLRHARGHRGEQAVALGLEVVEAQQARVGAVDVAQGLPARAVLVALADRLAVVGERDDRAEPERPPLGVVAREHLLVHVEEQLALAVLELHAARPGPAARGVDDVPVAVVVVAERVLAEPVERRLAADRARELRRRALRRRRRDRRDRELRRLRVVHDEQLDRVADELDVLDVGPALGLRQRGRHARLAALGVGDPHQLAGELERAVELGRDERREAPASGPPWRRSSPRRSRGRRSG